MGKAMQWIGLVGSGGIPCCSGRLAGLVARWLGVRICAGSLAALYRGTCLRIVCMRSPSVLACWEGERLFVLSTLVSGPVTGRSPSLLML